MGGKNRYPGRYVAAYASSAETEPLEASVLISDHNVTSKNKKNTSPKGIVIKIEDNLDHGSASADGRIFVFREKSNFHPRTIAKG